MEHGRRHHPSQPIRLRWLVASSAVHRQLETDSGGDAGRKPADRTEPCNEYQFLFEGQPSYSLRDFDLAGKRRVGEQVAAHDRSRRHREHVGNRDLCSPSGERGRHRPRRQPIAIDASRIRATMVRSVSDAGRAGRDDDVSSPADARCRREGTAGIDVPRRGVVDAVDARRARVWSGDVNAGAWLRESCMHPSRIVTCNSQCRLEKKSQGAAIIVQRILVSRRINEIAAVADWNAGG